MSKYTARLPFTFGGIDIYPEPVRARGDMEQLIVQNDDGYFDELSASQVAALAAYFAEVQS